MFVGTVFLTVWASSGRAVPTGHDQLPAWANPMSTMISYGVAGALLLDRRPDLPFGWLLSAVAVLLVIEVVVAFPAAAAIAGGDRGIRADTETEKRQRIPHADPRSSSTHCMSDAGSGPLVSTERLGRPFTDAALNVAHRQPEAATPRLVRSNSASLRMYRLAGLPAKQSGGDDGNADAAAGSQCDYEPRLLRPQGQILRLADDSRFTVVVDNVGSGLLLRHTWRASQGENCD
uniref:hypothetical protein n=1 Tax=Paractinoplanes polyasparticus TaxID=2856853 RepID=UPI001C846C2F|nr:hypothetical protein [Actinoplanes polyasparticus]